VVAVEELAGASFGDNDSLSGFVANLVDADLLILLSDVPGLHTADPDKDENAQLIPRVERIDKSIERLAGGTSGRGTGGMATKVRAAKMATAGGATVVITGYEKDVLLKVVKGESIGTLFPPTASKMESRKRWILSGMDTRGKLLVDNGAANALKKQNRSLLPAGIKAVEGKFERGDTVNIYDEDGERVACGITNYSSHELSIIKGSRSSQIKELLGYGYGDEVVHRNNLVVA